MRKYVGDDYRALYDMLEFEGLKPEEMSFDMDMTYIVDKSFFTLRSDNDFMHLIHFCVDKDDRTPSNARKLCKALKEVVVGKLIIHSKKEYLNRCIEYYFKTKPYEVKDGTNFYLVEVNNG